MAPGTFRVHNDVILLSRVQGDPKSKLPQPERICNHLHPPTWAAVPVS